MEPSALSDTALSPTGNDKIWSILSHLSCWFGVGIILPLVVYLASERLIRSPWGRVLKAIREDEVVAASVGKDVFRFKMQALVLGAMLMGLGGSFYAHYVKFISPDTFNPLMGTFLVWVMLMAGGSGNNRGAVVGATVIWGLWSLSDVLTNRLPSPLDTRASYLRVMLIGTIRCLLGDDPDLIQREPALPHARRTAGKLLPPARHAGDRVRVAR